MPVIPTLWTAFGAFLAAIAMLYSIRRVHPIYYPVSSGGPCFGQQRVVVVLKGVAKGVLFAILPAIVVVRTLGSLPVGGTLFLGFLIGTAVYGHWLMRSWTSLESCHICAEVKQRLQSLHVSAVMLGILVLATLLHLASPD
jgi:hypothetical protein